MKKKIIIAATIFTALLIALFYSYYNYRTRNAVEKLIKEKKMINILIAGRNVYHENRHNFFSLMSINPVNNKVGLTYIPPSYRIHLDSSGSNFSRIDEIDFIYFDKIKDTFKRDLKMSIPFYVKLYSKDVIRSVNLIEGIDLFVLDQMEDKSNFKFGVNYFDGTKIMKYINSVEENSIYLKYDRTLDILMSLYHNKEKYKEMNNLAFITELLRDLNSNLMPQELLTIGELVYNDGGIVSTLLPGGFEGGYYVTDNISYKTYEKEFLEPMIQDEESEPQVKIKVLNGTNVPGLARKLRTKLIREGFTVVEFGTSPYVKMNDSIIINRKGDYEAVKFVADFTGIKKIYNIVDNTELHNVLVIIGQDMVK